MIVLITEYAEADLERIGDYIARDNPRRAISFISEIVDRCEGLAEIPYGFPLVPRYEHLGVRRRHYADYLIFYRVSNDRIEILHILHGAQNFENILFSENGDQ